MFVVPVIERRIVWAAQSLVREPSSFTMLRPLHVMAGLLGCTTIGDEGVVQGPSSNNRDFPGFGGLTIHVSSICRPQDFDPQDCKIAGGYQVGDKVISTINFTHSNGSIAKNLGRALRSAVVIHGIPVGL